MGGNTAGRVGRGGGDAFIRRISASGSGAEILTMPWGKQIAELVGGKERSFGPQRAAF